MGKAVGVCTAGNAVGDLHRMLHTYILGLLLDAGNVLDELDKAIAGLRGNRTRD